MTNLTCNLVFGDDTKLYGPPGVNLQADLERAAARADKW